MQILSTARGWVKRFFGSTEPPSKPDNTWQDTLNLQPVHQAGFTGKGVGIAIIDTGIAAHPDIKGQIHAFKDFVNGRELMYDDNSHGTEVTTTAAGKHGAAPDANLVVLKAADAEGYVYANRVVAAIDWAIENRERYNIRVLNMSFELDDKTPEARQTVLQAVDRAVQVGMIPIACAGNDGPKPGGLQTLASWHHVVTVTSSDNRGTADIKDDVIADFATRGPGENGEDKPDVTTPGYHIWCGTPPGGYAQKDGTSLSVPMVVGVVADWLQANPRLTFDDVNAIIHSTARPLPNVPRTDQGAGTLDAAAGLQEALKKHPA